MEPVRPPELRELVRFVGIPMSALDESCSEEHARTISLSAFPAEWRSVAPHLGLSEVDIVAIENDSKMESGRRLKTLLKWREKYAFKATFKNLVEVLLVTGNASCAQTVCGSLKPKKAQKRQRESTDNTGSPVPASKKPSPLLHSFHLQFPSRCALERFLKTKQSVWENETDVFLIHQSNQPSVVATTAKRTDIETLLARNSVTHTVVLKPALIRNTQPGSCRFAECSDSICTTELSGPGALLPTNKDIHAIVFNETSSEPPSDTDSDTDCNQHILAVCVSNLDHVQENVKVKRLLDPENENSANFISVAADEFLKFVEMNPNLADVPSAIHEYVNYSAHPFPTPPDSN